MTSEQGRAGQDGAGRPPHHVQDAATARTRSSREGGGCGNALRSLWDTSYQEQPGFQGIMSSLKGKPCVWFSHPSNGRGDWPGGGAP